MTFADLQQPITAYAAYPDLADQVAVITGGAGGIGAETVRAFAAQGSRVVFIDVDDQAAQGVIAFCAAQKAKHQPLFIRADLSAVEALNALVDAIIAKVGTIDILINNAANDRRLDFAEADFYDAYIRSRALNIDSPLFLTRAVLQKVMIPAGLGVIVNISSVHAQMASDVNMLAYGAAKSGLNHFSQWVANTHGSLGIRSNAIEPGWIATQKQIETIMSPEAVLGCLAGQSIKRIGHPADIANAALFCASAASGFMNGGLLRVDGGAVGNFNSLPVDPEDVTDCLTRRSLGL